MIQTKSKFNIFTILGKDDKELIHSAFLKYILEEKFDEFNKCFKLQIPALKGIQLEKRRSVVSTDDKKRKWVRTDIEALDATDKPVLIIENKFKSFPYKSQLKRYDEVYKELTDDNNIVKLLFCFDPKIIPFTQEFDHWRFIGYQEFLVFVEELIPKAWNDEKVFLQHYHSFLKDLYEKYETYKADYKPLLENPKSRDHKFWLELMNSALRLKLERELGDESVFHVNPGNVMVPVLNYMPCNWKKDNNWELLIQVQGNELKFYIHFFNEWRNPKKGKVNSIAYKKEEKQGFLNERVEEIRGNSGFNKRGEIKTIGECNFNSCFLYKENLLDRLNGDRPVTIDTLATEILKFQKDVERVGYANKICTNS